jgi:hypothetical protein
VHEAWRVAASLPSRRRSRNGTRLNPKINDHLTRLIFEKTRLGNLHRDTGKSDEA